MMVVREVVTAGVRKEGKEVVRLERDLKGRGKVKGHGGLGRVGVEEEGVPACIDCRSRLLFICPTCFSCSFVGLIVCCFLIGLYIYIFFFLSLCCFVF